MKFKLSIIALSLANLGVASATNFDLSRANIQDLDKHRWRCQRCLAPATNGELGVSVVGMKSQDIKAANVFGEDSEFAAALQADVRYPSSGDNGRVQLYADDLGLETGSGQVIYRKKQLEAYLGYRSLIQVDTAHALTSYGFDGSNLINRGELTSMSLQKKRQNWLLGSEYQEGAWRGYIDYQYQQKTGDQACSVVMIKRPVNLVKPIDYTTQNLKLGAEVGDDSWLASLGYQGSQFENRYDALYNGERGAALALAPSNEAHQVWLSGQYRWQQTALSGRVVRGWQYQSQGYVDGLGVPSGITHLNGKVDVWDANLKLTTRISRDIRLNLKADYRDRDNNTPLLTLPLQLVNTYDGLALARPFLSNSRHAYQLDARYRLTPGMKLGAGYQYIKKERLQSTRQHTDENRLFAKLRYTGWAQWSLSLDGELSQRKGNSDQAYDVNFNVTQPRMVKYHLADRDRNQLKFKVSHSPLANLGLALSYRYAKDDYSASQIGLLDANHQGYDLSANYQVNSNIKLNLFMGQSWIDSSQAGSQNHSVVDWYGDVEDSVNHVGVSGVYSGLMLDALALGVDYQYSESTSNTLVSSQVPFDDSFTWSHHLTVFANYHLNKRTKIKADYRYQRHYDTDYANIAPTAMQGLTTLGYLGSNYNAHQLMLTFAYTL